jgi:exodeoxyribonuclease-1
MKGSRVQTFYWHDYETWGTNPAIDRPSQFAGLRTDLDFNIIGEPLVIYCRPPQDLLPQPDACLITGITPQYAREHGLSERDFVSAIHDELSQPGTCGVGYNSLRFDDEVTRYALYRNFYDPYAREWQSGNSRWDIIDMVRACRALRPDGIEWPNGDDGSPSFKLEQLTAANGLRHEHAHDALSDVYATIAIAKLIKTKQPKLFDYLFNLRNKREVAKLLDLGERRPVLHISGMFPAERGCGALVMPLLQHPTNSNGIVCYDLSVDPEPLLTLDAAEIRRRLFTPSAELDAPRIALKTIHTNRCPVVVTAKMIDERVAALMQIDVGRCEQHRQQLLAATTLEMKLRDVLAEPPRTPITDPEQALYSGGFLGDADRALIAQLRAAPPQELRQFADRFRDKRLREMLFRYRARNFPESLSAEERVQWRNFCRARLTDPAFGGGLLIDQYRRLLDEREAEAGDDAAQRALLQQLRAYGDELLANCVAK